MIITVLIFITLAYTAPIGKTKLKRPACIRDIFILECLESIMASIADMEVRFVASLGPSRKNNRGQRRRERIRNSANGFMDINNPVVISPPVGIILLRNIVLAYVLCLAGTAITRQNLANKAPVLRILRRTGRGNDTAMMGRMLMPCQIITTRQTIKVTLTLL